MIKEPSKELQVDNVLSFVITANEHLFKKICESPNDSLIALIQRRDEKRPKHMHINVVPSRKFSVPLPEQRAVRVAQFWKVLQPYFNDCFTSNHEGL